jgi:peptide-methionine (R)-S-oxide reductase
MNRRRAIYTLGSVSLLAVAPAILRARETRAQVERLEKSDDEWRKLLPEDRFEVLFREATEPAGSSPLNEEKRKGTFVCAACKLPLFESAHKFESGTGWPSFTQPIEGSMGTKRDFKLILPRTEYHCARCGGHQGHVFNDGPRPRGERWCNNGLALEFVPEGEPLPELVS